MKHEVLAVDLTALARQYAKEQGIRLTSLKLDHIEGMLIDDICLTLNENIGAWADEV